MFYSNVIFYFLSIQFLCIVEAALTRTAIEIPTKGPKYEDDEKPSNKNL